MPYDIDQAVAHIARRAKNEATGKCATYVREALEAGGMNTTGRPVSAKDYGPFLKTHGFASVPLASHVPTKGDIVVIQPYKGGSVHGHIAMYDGNQWLSDFKQRDMWGGPGYRKNTPAYEVFRP
jgi:type VI secretion system secreted protein VgrG